MSVSKKQPILFSLLVHSFFVITSLKSYLHSWYKLDLFWSLFWLVFLWTQTPVSDLKISCPFLWQKMFCSRSFILPESPHTYSDLNSYFLWTQGWQFISSVGLMQVKFRNIPLRCIARRHASHKHKHIRCSDILTRHVCSCTCICIRPDTLLIVTTQTWFPSRFGDNQDWLSNKIVCVVLIHI